MFRNRSFNIFVVLALVVVIFFTVRQVTATSDLIKTDRSYDQAEQVRVDRSANVQADRSYDAIEAQRTARTLTSMNQGYEQLEALRIQRTYSSITADRSYDAIENIRAARRYQK
jgi:hypothetical protein